MSLPTSSEAAAFGRHVASYAAGAATALGAIHVLTPADATTAVSAINEIWDGVAKLCAVLAPVVAMASAWWASRSASPASQIKAVNAGDNGVKVVPASSPIPAIDHPLK